MIRGRGAGGRCGRTPGVPKVLVFESLVPKRNRRDAEGFTCSCAQQDRGLLAVVAGPWKQGFGRAEVHGWLPEVARSPELAWLELAATAQTANLFDGYGAGATSLLLPFLRMSFHRVLCNDELNSQTRDKPFRFGFLEDVAQVSSFSRDRINSCRATRGLAISQDPQNPEPGGRKIKFVPEKG